MGLAERRKALGHSQETFAHALGVDRTTVGRWESGKTEPQVSLRPRLAAVLRVDLAEVGALVAQSRGQGQSPVPAPPGDDHPLRDSDDHHLRDSEDMIRREFLRAIAMVGALTSGLPADQAAALDDAAHRGRAPGFLQMNDHLWQVYQLARAKRAVRPIVREQLSALTSTLQARSGAEARMLCGAAGDLFQLAGELAFDSSRYTDAAASYALAASASREARAYDLWACALVRHAYVDLCEHRLKDAIRLLSAAEMIARRGDSALSTRHWVASVQAEAFAGMGDLAACERALDAAEEVAYLAGPGHNGGWLRFDGSRLAEERGARYVQLGRLDLAEQTLRSALEQGVLAHGHSFRRRGVVLADLAAVGAKRRDPDQVIVYGREALALARESSSGYVARRLQGLRGELGPMAHDSRVAELGAEIGALSKT
ncbi:MULTISPECIES: helix-turn-helix transcriptional regulator [unclassified Streptomyces]|uniref:helix-turn-helix transcriptional regulator n=1 Tax=unclassified Streptomyces TaxID=2593676 RepID=UPI0033CF75EA